MTKTLLAVDDSVTMRKVIEMTFAGENVRVLAVANAQDALSTCRRERPDAVVADVALDGLNGYDLCRAIKDEFERIPVVLLSSKQNPFDPAKGQAAGADGHLDKPYDTAKAIELVKGVMSQPQTAAPPAAAPREPARAPMFTAAQPSAIPAPPAPQAAPQAAQPSHPTMAGIAAPRGVPLRPSLEPRAPRPTMAGRPPAALKPQPTPTASASATTPDLAPRLRELGLSPAQVDAVVALSREVVERVVWEVVPVLAETMIREEIARLTREG